MVLTEAAIAGVLEKAFLKNFAKLTGKYLSYLITLQVPGIFR